MPPVPEPDFSLKSDDLLPLIRSRLMSDEEEPQTVDLTGALSVRFIMREDAGGGIPGTTKVDAVAAIVAPASSGIVEYAWQVGDTDVPGKYLGEWEVVWSNGKPQTFPTRTYHTIEIVADMGGVA